MSIFTNIWVSTLTRDFTDAGSFHELILIINDPNGIEKHHGSIGNKTDHRANGSLYKFNVSPKNINTTDLGNYISIGTKGDDQWSPRHIFVWGETESGDMVSIAMEVNITTRLGTEFGEGNISIPIRKVSTNPPTTSRRGWEIKRLLLIVKTENFVPATETTHGNFDTSTDDSIKLKIMNNKNAVVVDHIIEDTSQNDLEHGVTNFYFIPVISSFRVEDLNTVAITLSILGDDMWSPSKLFLFGLDSELGRPSQVIPLVHSDPWTQKNLSTDPTDTSVEAGMSISSTESVQLELLEYQSPLRQPAPDDGGVLQ